MPLTYRSLGNRYQISSYSNLIPTPITNVAATSTVAGQIVVTWSGGAGYKPIYTYSVYNNTGSAIVSPSAYTISGTNPTTLTLTDTTSNSYTVTVTSNVLDGSGNGLSNAITSFPPIVPLMWYKFDSGDTNVVNTVTGVKNYATNLYDASFSSTGVSISTTTYKFGTGSLAITGGAGTGGGCIALPALNLTGATTGFTFCTWVNYTTKNIWTPLVMLVGSTASIRIGAWGGGEQFTFNFSFTGGTSYVPYVNISPTLSTWYHVAVTVSNSYVYTIYINNTAYTPGTAPGGVITGGANANTYISTILYNSGNLLGSDTTGTSGGYRINGFMDDFRIYPNCLTAAQIDKIYNNQSL